MGCGIVSMMETFTLMVSVCGMMPQPISATLLRTIRTIPIAKVGAIDSSITDE